MIHIHMMKLLIFTLVIFTTAIVESQPLESTGKQIQTTAPVKSYPANPFAANSAIFKIPVLKTINLDFRNANNSIIQSELLKVLKDSLQNKALNQEKLIINVKPPKNSNSLFAKNFTSLLRNETTFLAPDAVVGAQSTIFKKKSGEISTLRLTLYVIRQKKPISRSIPLKITSHHSVSQNPFTEEANINLTQSQNITATVESVLRQLYENSTENGTVHRTDIFLNLISSTNFSSMQIKSLKRSIRQILLQLYPNSTISIQARLLYRRNTHVSKLEFEIDIQPHVTEASRKIPKDKLKQVYNTKQPLISSFNLTIKTRYDNETKPIIRSIAVNGTKSVENTTTTIEYLLGTIFKKMTGEIVNRTYINLDIMSPRNFSTDLKKKMEESLNKLIYKVFPSSSISFHPSSQYNQNQNISLLNFNISVTPKYKPEKIQGSSRQKINLTMISPNKDSAQSVKQTLDTLKKDLHELIPESQLLIQARKVISEDLDLLTKALKSQEKEPNKMNILMDLTRSGASFDTEFDKVLPHILATVNESLEPITLAFRIAIPNGYNEDSISSDVCSFLKTLTSNIPAKTRFGEIDIDVTLLPGADELAPKRSQSKIARVLDNVKQELQADSSKSPLTNKTLQKLLNLTEPGINMTQEINNTLAEFARQLQYNEKSLQNQFNISLIIPRNETKLFVKKILSMIKRDVMILFPYSQILMQAQDLIAKDLHILKLNIGLKQLSDKKRMHEVLPIDLSELGENSPGELEDLLKPLWSTIKKNRPTSFDLKLRPVNDIGRGRLGNDVCFIVDTLTKSLPKEIALDDIILQTTVLPDKKPTIPQTPEEEDLDAENSSEEQDLPSRIRELKKIRENIKKEMFTAWEEFSKGLEDDINNITQANNLSSSVQIPENDTHESVEERMRNINNDLLELAPYADVINKEQTAIMDELHALDLNKNQEHKKPMKKFKVDLSEDGEFLPEEVDKVVYDIRNSENPFSFALEMVIPEDVDLESASSEICSMSNIVINNIPKESLLTGTILRVTVLPKIKNSLNDKRNLHESFNGKNKKIQPLHEKLSDQNPFRQPSEAEDNLSQPKGERMDSKESIPDDSRKEEEEDISKSSEEGSNKYLTPSSLSPLGKLISIPSHQSQPINPTQKLKFYRRKQQPPYHPPNEKPKGNFDEPLYSETDTPSTVTKTDEKPAYHRITKLSQGKPPLYIPKLMDDTEDQEKVSQLSKIAKKMTSKTENNKALLQPFSDLYNEVTSRRVSENSEPSLEIQSRTPDNLILHQETINGQPKIRSLQDDSVTDEKNGINDQEPFRVDLETPEEESREVEEKTNNSSTENDILEVEPTVSQITKIVHEPTKEKSRISKGIQGFKNGILKGIGKLSSAVKSIVQNKQTEIPSLAKELSMNTPKDENEKNIIKRITKPMSVSNIDLDSENIPLAKSYPENTDEVESLRKEISLPKSIPQLKSKIMPLLKLYPEDTDGIGSSSEELAPSSMGVPQIKTETGKFPPTSGLKNFLRKRVTHPVKTTQLKQKKRNIPLTMKVSNFSRKDTDEPNSPTDYFGGGQFPLENSQEQTEPAEEVISSTEYPESSESTSESEKPSLTFKNVKLPETKSAKTPRRYRKRSNNNFNDVNSEQNPLTPNNREDDDEETERKIETTLIKAYNNDQDDIFEYTENLNLWNSTANLTESILNVAAYVIQIVPRNKNETIVLTLNIRPPRNTTVNYLKNITNLVISHLVSSLPNDMVNIGTKVTKNKNNVVTRAQMKITISSNENIEREIEEKEYLKNKFRNESRMVQNLTRILDALIRDVKQELNIKDHLGGMSNNNTETELRTSLEDIESFMKESLYSIVSDILSAIKNSSESGNFNFTFSLNAPAVVSQNFVDHFTDLLKAILIDALPGEDVTIEAKSLKSDTNTTIKLVVNLEPRTIFTTSPIDLDDLNILDVESVLTKIISTYISRLQETKVYDETIIVDFIFETSHISSLNLVNIESAIDDVFNALKLKGELMTEDIKLGLTKKNVIIIKLPYIINTLNFVERRRSSSQAGQQEEKTPKPLEMISDLILAI